MSTAADLTAFTKKRGTVKSRLTRLAATVEGLVGSAAPYDVAYLDGYITKLEAIYADFEIVQGGIETLDLTEEQVTEQQAEATQFQNRYDLAFRALHSLRATAQRPATTHETTPTPSTTESQPAAVRVNIRLPPINLPTFSGKFEDWLPFHDQFSANIHNKDELGAVEKYQYLVSALSGDAADLVANLPLTEDNYTVAWDILIDHYHNTKSIRTNYIKCLLQQDSMQSESATQLHLFATTTKKCLGALERLGRDDKDWVYTFTDCLLLHLLVPKLDFESRREWEFKTAREHSPSTENFIKFLHSRAEVLRSLPPRVKASASQRPAFNQPTTKVTTSVNSSHKEKCLGCGSLDHPMYRCPSFLPLSSEERRKLVRAKNACFNCLRGHQMKDCKSITCRKCNQRHHTSLHVDAPAVQPSSHLATTGSMQALLSTAIVYVEDSRGNLQKCRALLDDGSQVNAISAGCATRLGLLQTKSAVALTGVGGISAGGRSTSTLFRVISRMDSRFTHEVEAHVLPQVTTHLPQSPAAESSWTHTADLDLADPTFAEPGEIDLLLGVVFKNSVRLDGRRKGPPGTPIAEETTLGWILSGELKSSTRVAASLTVTQTLDTALRAFWEMEELPNVKHLTTEQKQCEEHFATTFTRDDKGRYQVRLPFKSEKPVIGESKSQAVKRLHSVERSLDRSPSKKAQYHAFMQEFLDLGHMVKVAPSSSPHTYFLPHHAVCREESTTTKLRVVFDASAKSTTGLSLNSEMLVGPTIQDDLFNILVRFRKHKVAFTADICKMFRQILVDRQDTPYQRIVWRFSPFDPIEEYELLTVTYGTAAAPFLSMRCLKQLSIDEGHRCPEAARVIAEDFYVDDCCSGAPSTTAAIELFQGLNSIMESAQLQLRKYATNDPGLLEVIPEALQEKAASLEFGADAKVKTLGLRWSPSEDSFFFSVQPFTATFITKRVILSDLAKVFDPLGWLSPTTISAKILMQKLWLVSCDWDQEVPSTVKDLWLSYRSNLKRLEALRIPRCINPNVSTVLELHGFSDASEAAMSACLYLRATHDDHVTVFLIAAKTKVAPIKTVSLPRLELCAAHMLAKLTTSMVTALKLNVAAVHAWSDSTITLNWLQAHPSTWKCFVANRVSHIQDVVPPSNWHHVKSEDNPADCASRGISAEDLIDHPTWWTGPNFLHQPVITYPLLPGGSVIMPERRPSAHHLAERNEDEMLTRHSTFTKLRRVTAWMQRFLQNSRGVRTSGPLTTTELEAAFTTWVKYTQEFHFSKEKVAILKSRTEAAPVRHAFTNLQPFIDNEGIVRVGGRLRNSSLSYGCKHPILLPKSGHLTRLMIQHYHLVNLHSGPTLTLASIRQRFWIVDGRNCVRRYIATCVHCHRITASPTSTLMGDLPSPRVTITPTFFHCGVDYAGPYFLKSKTGRGSVNTKAYISVFVCMATKAIHLELASDLSTSAFLAAFHRFSSTRGKPSHMFSDQGTNFVGADRELQRFIKSDEFNDAMTNSTSTDLIQWHFNPPASPHHGGLWEAAVKSVKSHLKRTCSEAVLTYEELLTVLKQVEACLNSRPLSPLSSSPEDLQPLTPGHFLIGQPLNAIPEPDVSEVPSNRLTRWELIRKNVQGFWKRWSMEYLTQLQQRPKWTEQRPNISVGDMVLLKDRTAPTKWHLGRITQTHPGRDGIVRVVTVKTGSSTFERPITSISVLPINDVNN